MTCVWFVFGFCISSKNNITFLCCRLQEVKSQPQNMVMDSLFTDPWTTTFNKVLCRQDYVIAKSMRLQGLLLLVYTQMKHITHLRDIEAQYTKTGLGGMWVSCYSRPGFQFNFYTSISFLAQVQYINFSGFKQPHSDYVYWLFYAYIEILHTYFSYDLSIRQRRIFRNSIPTGWNRGEQFVFVWHFTWIGCGKIYEFRISAF